MDKPLVELARASGILVDSDHEWPLDVDKDIEEFINSDDPRAIFIVEQEDGLIVGPSPRSASDIRALAIAKPRGPLDSNRWLDQVVSISLPLSEGVPFAALHTLLAKMTIPLFDAQNSQLETGNAGAQARLRLVEAERTLSQLLRHTQITFVDLSSGVAAQRARSALTSNDINALQSVFNGWKQQLTQLAQTDRDAKVGSASDEAGFWLALEAALRSVQEQVEEAPLVRDVWNALSESKRFHATHNFDADTGIKQALHRAQQNATLFRDLPLGELLAASTIPQLVLAMEAVFQHLHRKLRNSTYPAHRSVLFVEAVGRDFAANLLKLSEQRLDDAINESGKNPDTELDRALKEVLEANESWDTQVRDFSTFVRDLIRKRGEKFTVVRVRSSHTALVARAAALDALAAKHRELQAVLKSETLSKAFTEVVQTPEVLRISDTAWRELEVCYLKEAQAAEREVAEQLRQQLVAASSDSELLRIFSHHAGVLARPQVRAVAHEFQSRLLDGARTDLASTSRRARSVIDSRDDDIVAKVLRMNQLRLRTDEIRSRLIILLGSDWAEHSVGAQIGADCDLLEKQLDPTKNIEKWATRVLNTDARYDLPVFGVENDWLVVTGFGSGSNGVLTALKTLKALGFRFELKHTQAAEQLADLDAAETRLNDAIATLLNVSETLVECPRVNYAGDVREHSRMILAFVRTGFGVRWGSKELPEFVTGFEQAVGLLDQRVTTLSRADKHISSILESASTPVGVKIDTVRSALDSAVVSPEYSQQVQLSLKQAVSQQICFNLQAWEAAPLEYTIEIRGAHLALVPELSTALKYWMDNMNEIVKPGIEVCGTHVSGYMDTVSRIMEVWNRAKQQWASWRHLWTLTHSSHDDKQDLKSVSLLLEDLLNSRSPSSNAPLLIDASAVKSQNESKSKSLQSIIVSKLADLTQAETTLLLSESRNFRKQLGLKVSVEFTKVHSATFELLRSNRIEMLDNAFSLLSKCEFIFPSDWATMDTIRDELQALEQIYESSKHQLLLAKPALLGELEQQTASLVMETGQFKHRWHAERPLQAQIEPQKALNVLRQFRAELESRLSTQINNISSSFESLDATRPSSLLKLDAQVSDWLSEISVLEHGWSELAQHFAKFNSIGSMPYTTDVKAIIQLQSAIEELPDRAKQLASSQRLNTLITRVVANLPQLRLLQSSDALLPKHFAHLVPTFPAKSKSLPMLKDLWTQLPSVEQVNSVIELAEGEHRLLQYIEQVQAKWAATRLEGSNGAIRNLDSVLTLASDNLAAFSGMRSSPYFSSISSVVGEWERKLGQATQLLDKFVDCQQQYLYLNGVLTSTAVSAVLPTEARRFRGVKDEFMEIFNIANSALALEFITSSRLEQNLNRVSSQFSSLNRSLSGFLETQRRRFARFYFIGDDELLEIVGNNIDLWGFKHLPSLFPNISTIKKDDSGQICAVESSDGEVLEINVVISNDDNVELLLNIEREVKRAVKENIFQSISGLENSWEPSMFGQFVERTPLQFVLVALREQWSRSPRNEDEIQKLLQWCSSAGSDSPLWARRRECLVAELTYELEHQPNELSTKVVRDKNEILIQCGPCSRSYGYEFLQIEAVVRTNVTNELYLSACCAIAQNKGGSIIGPAGTGKTESVKALGAFFGRNVVVFNCDEGFDANSVQRIMTGCGQTKSWSCFDEFNRLTRKVLSSVASTVGNSVKLSPVFVTMNPGYAGRTVLPANMRDEFREFILAKPDAQKISQVLLYAHAQSSQSAADAVVEMLDTMKRKSSNQKHYDWGLRALKGVLRVCREIGDMRKACEVAIRPRLMQQDIQIFDEELEKIPSSLSINTHSTTKKMNFDEIDVTIRPYVESLHTFIHLFAGVMLLGPTGSGKTTVWKTLSSLINAETVVVDPSAISKNALLGSLDPLTREWTDGLLSRVLRRVHANLRGEMQREWFVVFSGEVEPPWAEALNSLLDENRQLTLASGEILVLPKNFHIIFETTNLNSATPATVSRCGMICLPPPVELLPAESIPLNIQKSAQNIDHIMTYIPRQAEMAYNSLELGNKWLSMAWALAGDSNIEGRLAISDAIRKEANDQTIPDGNLLEYYISDLTGRWHAWQDSIDIPKLPSDSILRPDVVVPTADTEAHESLLQAALACKRPLLLVGPPGSGKTMTLFNALRKMPQIALIALNFSSTASPQLVIQALETHCEYSVSSDGTKVLSPSGSRRAALFIDEINLPQINEYGVSAVLQFLHHLIEFGGFYNSQGEFVAVERVQIVGACNPPPHRRPLPESFQRHFVIINVQHPSSNALRTIYTAFMTGIDAESLVEPMLEVYEALHVIEPDEIWTPRELTRWARSVYTALNTASASAVSSSNFLNRIFAYEGYRVLADRLVHPQKICDLISKASKTSASDSSVFSHFISKRPTFVSLQELQQFFSARLPAFVEEASGEGDSALVAHSGFVKLVSQVDRVLRQHQGHTLLVGPPSIGKTTAVRFACWANGLDLRMLRINSQYHDSNFAEDLRNVLLATLRRPLCFVLGEELLKTPEFVERMNSLLANGEVPGLFSEKQQELEDQCRRAGYNGQGDLTSWFRQKVVNNLHVTFTTTGLGETSPALLNRCTVIRVSEWSDQIKTQISASWCGSTDVDNNVVQCLSQIPCENGREFVELCSQFVKVYSARKEELEDTQRHLLNGGTKLKEALLEVSHLKKHLALQQEKLEVENKRSSEVLTQMLSEQSTAERKRATAIEIRHAVQKQNEQISERQDSANNNLAAAEPLIAQAAQGVQNIKKSQLNELRSLANPPEPVKITLEAVCFILGLRTDGSWRQVLQAVRGDEFIPRIVNFDSEMLTPAVAAKVENEYMSMSCFTYERVDRASKACGPLLRWVVAQVAYSQALKAVKPLLEEISSLNDQARESQAQLDAIESMLTDLEQAIDTSKLEYGKAVAQCESLKADMHNVQQQLARAEQLLASLSSEKTRWIKGSEDYPQKVLELPGTSIFEASQIALGGKLDVSDLANLNKSVKELLKGNDLLTTEVDVSRNDCANKTFSTALIIDPNNAWIAEDAKTTNFLLDSDALLKELDSALRFGQHIIIKHAERFDPLAMPLVNREFFHKGARLLVNLGQGDIDVAKGFKLTLHARDLTSVQRNYPHLISKVTVVNFSMTPSGFEKMVGDALLSAKMPELAQRRSELHKVKTTTATELRKLEKDLLEALNTSSTKLLENHQLVHTLETLKSESLRLQELQETTTQTLAELDEAYSKFSPAAVDAAEVYVNAQAYAKLDPFYVIHVDWLWQIAQTLVHSEEFSTRFNEEINNRIASVVNHKDSPSNSHRLRLVDLIREANCTVPIVAGMATTNTADPAHEIVIAQPDTHIIAMGSHQSENKADLLLDNAMERGEWVVIQNAEIADEKWLRSLSRRLQSSRPDSMFRLVLTGMQSELVQIPDLITSGRAVSIERVQGIKAQLQSNLQAVSSQSHDQFVLNWIHSCFTEVFPSANFSQRDFESVIWLSGKLNASILHTAVLTTVWQAKISSTVDKNRMSAFAEETWSQKLPNEKQWISMIPDDFSWRPKTLQ